MLRSSTQPEADFNDIHVSSAFRMPIAGMAHARCRRLLLLPGLRVQENLVLALGTAAQQLLQSRSYEIDAVVYCLAVSGLAWPVRVVLRGGTDLI